MHTTTSLLQPLGASEEDAQENHVSIFPSLLLDKYSTVCIRCLRARSEPKLDQHSQSAGCYFWAQELWRSWEQLRQLGKLFEDLRDLFKE